MVSRTAFKLGKLSWPDPNYLFESARWKKIIISRFIKQNVLIFAHFINNWGREP